MEEELHALLVKELKDHPRLEIWKWRGLPYVARRFASHIVFMGTVIPENNCASIDYFPLGLDGEPLDTPPITMALYENADGGIVAALHRMNTMQLSQTMQEDGNWLAMLDWMRENVHLHHLAANIWTEAQVREGPNTPRNPIIKNDKSADEWAEISKLMTAFDERLNEVPD